MAAIHGTGGDDTLNGTADGDAIGGDAGNDSIEGNGGNDSIGGGAGSDTIRGGAGADGIGGDDGDDIISGGDGDDNIGGGTGNDTIEGDSGNDGIGGDAGDDSISGGDGNDTIGGGADNDTIRGDDGGDLLGEDGGDDSIYGGSGNDTLFGDDGQDELYGGSGEDYFDGGADNDSLYMGDTSGSGTSDPSDGLRDVVRLHPGSGEDTAFDFDMANDYIFIEAAERADVTLTQISASQWVVTHPDAGAGDSLTINFLSGAEPANEAALRMRLINEDLYTPPANGQPAQWNLACFIPTSRIMTPQGLRKIGSLRRGDQVLTADAGPQPVLQVLSSQYDASTIRDTAALRPVIIDAGAFGDGLPKRQMAVSRQHCFALSGGRDLIRAIYLAEHLPHVWIQRNRPNRVKYIHLVLAKHHFVQVEGVWAETFFANAAMTADTLAGTMPHHRIQHAQRCARLLTRADMRKPCFTLALIGHIDKAAMAQSAPSTRAETATASAPAGVIP